MARQTRSGYSIHVIHPNGAPAPVGWRQSKRKAADLAAETAAGTGLEVRVWDTRDARCVTTIAPAPEAGGRMLRRILIDVLAIILIVLALAVAMSIEA